jgi:STAS domain
MLRITRASNGEVVYRLSGRMDAENVGELRSLLSAEIGDRQIVLDLKDLTLVDQGAVSFLRRCEAHGIQLRSCPAYIREWIHGEQHQVKKTIGGPNECFPDAEP